MQKTTQDILSVQASLTMIYILGTIEETTQALSNICNHNKSCVAAWN